MSLVCYAEVLGLRELGAKKLNPSSQNPAVCWAWCKVRLAKIPNSCYTRCKTRSLTRVLPSHQTYTSINRNGFSLRQMESCLVEPAQEDNKSSHPLPTGCLASVFLLHPKHGGRWDILGGKAAWLAAQVCNNPFLCMPWCCYHGSTPSACKYTHSRESFAVGQPMG